jgi:hypothetical protein
MFEVNREYANRKGTYTVLAIDEPIMSVRYADGTEAELNMNIQARIWENIQAEQEASSAKSSSRKRHRRSAAAPTVGHYIKVVSNPPGEELSFPGWDARVVLVEPAKERYSIKKGDRLIFYAPEEQNFFAVATVTGDPFTADPKKYIYAMEAESVDFCQIDIDLDTGKLTSGVSLDSIELESCPDFEESKIAEEMFCQISEDDFELLAEAITEVTELEEEDLNDEDDFDEEDV